MKLDSKNDDFEESFIEKAKKFLKQNNTPYICATIINIATMCYLAFLACYFNHWWIILFARLFMFKATYEKHSEDKEDEQK